MPETLGDFVAVAPFVHKVELQGQIFPHFLRQPTKLEVGEETRHQCHKQLHIRAQQHHWVSVLFVSFQHYGILNLDFSSISVCIIASSSFVTV